MEDELQRLREHLRDDECEPCEVCGERAVVRSEGVSVCLACVAIWRRESVRAPWSLVVGLVATN